MGELCHTKGSLRLPLELVSSTSSEVSDFMSDQGNTKEQEVTETTNNEDESLKQPKSILDVDEDESDKLDSLSSNSSSPPNTFGKDHVTKESSGRTSIIFIEDDVEPIHVDIQKNARNIEGVIDEKYILSHSDEDSGFENITNKLL